MRYKTTDVTDREKFKVDEFTLHVISSGETLNDYCDYAALSIDPVTLMTDGLHYHIEDDVVPEYGPEKQPFEIRT
jgi:hypothetical protein